jgi:aconitate hydratase
MPADSFGARSTLEVAGLELEIFRVDALAERFDIAHLPFSLKILLENLLRNEGKGDVTAADVEALAGWDAAKRQTYVGFSYILKTIQFN